MMIWLVLFIIISLVFSGLFSGSEIAFLSASKLRIELEKEKKSKVSKALTAFYKEPQRYLSAMLVGNNIALVVFSTLMTMLLEVWFVQFGFGEMATLLTGTVVITIIVLIFGEFLPKSYFRHHATRLMIRLANPLHRIVKMLSFPTWIMMSLSTRLIRLVFKRDYFSEEPILTRLDLQRYIEDRVEDADMFNNALQFKDLKVRDVMVPRTEIVYVDIHNKPQALIEVISEHKLSRVIVVNEDIDDIVGYVHHQSLLHKADRISDLIKTIDFVPETLAVTEVLKLFRKSGKSIACVVDEYGGTAGIVTLEDIIEEIFGEIEDEHDEDDLIAENLGEGMYRFSGRAEISYINDKFPELKLPDGDYQTISGFVLHGFGRIPEEGVAFNVDAYHVTCEKVSEKRIEQVLLSIQSS